MQKEIREEIERFGTIWNSAVIQATRQLYARPGVSSNKYHGGSEVVATENIHYGSHERNVLDVYAPKHTAETARSVLVFAHGGGLVVGDKGMYNNIGTYFASHDIIAVIISYRLVPNITYPDGGDDIQAVREWVYNNISKPEFGHGDPEKVVLAGHSAGGLHIATNIYAAGDPSRSTEANSPPLAAVVYLSTQFSFEKTPSERRSVLKAYYGSDVGEEIHSHIPMGLMDALPADSAVLDPKQLPCLIILTQYEPVEIQHPIFQFIDRYRYKNPRGMLPEVTVMRGHNHLSNVCSIGTEDDRQGRVLREFINEVCSK